MIAWSVELSKISIECQPQGPIKAKVMADFVAELTTDNNGESDKDTWILLWNPASNCI